MEARNLYSDEQVSQSDLDLWDGLLAGRKSALQHLFLKYHDDLSRYGFAFCSHKASVEDSIQDLFYQLWINHTSLSKVDNVKAYLLISFRRSLLKKLEKHRRTTRLFKIEDDQFGVVASKGKMMIDAERIRINKKLLRKALDELSGKEREALYLKYYEGMSYKEIQMIMDINYQTARNYIYRAISNLRKSIETELNSSVVSATLGFVLLTLFA